MPTQTKSGKKGRVRLIVTLKGSAIRVYSNRTCEEVQVSVLDYDNLYAAKAGSEEHKMYTALEKELKNPSVLNEIF